MAEYNNWERFVTAQYVRAFAPNGIGRTRACPNCENKLRDRSEEHAVRHTTHE
jgi:hypothetical protein